jgi:hypothetical protein
MGKKEIVAKFEAAPIILGCLDGLRKTTNNLSQDSRVSAEIRSGNLSNTSRSKLAWQVSKVKVKLSLCLTN